MLNAGENLMGRNGRDLGPDREADMCGGAPIHYVLRTVDR